eukprot:SAG11_NODE_29689_length_308_cov_0.909091_1_plen_73_part_01
MLNLSHSKFTTGTYLLYKKNNSTAVGSCPLFYCITTNSMEKGKLNLLVQLYLLGLLVLVVGKNSSSEKMYRFR